LKVEVDSWGEHPLTLADDLARPEVGRQGWFFWFAGWLLRLKCPHRLPLREVGAIEGRSLRTSLPIGPVFTGSAHGIFPESIAVEHGCAPTTNCYS
jgi:hypothetical protein